MTDRDLPQAAMVFAAGFGTRMGDLTATRPKPLIPIAGRPLLDHALDLVRAEARHIVVNTHYLAEQITAHLVGSGVMIATEHPSILETGGGLRAALPILGSGPVYTLNPDVVWAGPNPLTCLRGTWRAEIDSLLLLVPRKAALGRIGPGDFSMDRDGRLSRGGDLVYTGAEITRTGKLSRIDETAFSLNRLWDIHAQAGGLFGTIYPGRWCDVGHPKAIPLAEGMLADG